jgi:predicted ABC-type sugar transport system permease subunit
MSNFFTTAYARLKTESPAFFKKISTIGKSLMATGTTAIAAQIIPQVKMPPALITLGTHAIVAGFVMTLVASLTCQTPPDIPPTTKP